MTIYKISVITCTGYPFFSKQIHEFPKNVDLHLRFFDLSNMNDRSENFAQSFELFAGLISALTEFSRLLGQKLELLKFKAQKELDEIALKFTESKEISVKFDENGGYVQDQNSLYPIEVDEGTDVLITCQNERFLNPIAIEAKINMIFDKVIRDKIPLGPESDREMTEENENFIMDILDNKEAIERVLAVKPALDITVNELLSELKGYGLKGIVITSFDYTPILNYGKIEMDDVYLLLRDIGRLPIVGTWKWDYRRGKIRKGQKIEKYWVYIVNSGIGPSILDVFMEFHYLLITEPNSFLAETPMQIYQKLNSIID
ncbi:MAG: hypothetical protein GY870_18425 [archaeon]|nr:hypothetical protein [archaeon]